MPKYYAYPARPTEEQFYRAKAAAVAVRETFGEFVVKAVEERIARESQHIVNQPACLSGTTIKEGNV